MKVINQEVELLCLFDEGVPSPIRLRLTNEEGQKQVVKIDKVIQRDFEKLAGNRMYVYTCQCEINDVLRTITLKYELDTCKWFIYKM